MSGHMLKYHVGVPLAVFSVLVVVGVPLASALRLAVAAGCASMMLMMVTGGGDQSHRRARPHQAEADGTATKPEPR